MASKLGAFGKVVFETSDSRVLTFHGLRRRQKARYATHDVINHDQLLQFLTVELAVVRFQIKLHHRFCDPRAEITRLKEMLQEHGVHQLTVGGKPLGRFVLENLSDRWKYVAPNGVVMHATGEVSLKEYR